STSYATDVEQIEAETPKAGSAPKEYSSMKTPPPNAPAWMRADRATEITPPPVPHVDNKGTKNKTDRKKSGKASFSRKNKRPASIAEFNKAYKKAKAAQANEASAGSDSEPESTEPSGEGALVPREAAEGDAPAPAASFKGYSLDWVPIEARPQGDISKHRGQHSYTVVDADCKVEVLLRLRAFYVKKCKAGFPGPIGQVNTKKFSSVEETWNAVKTRSGFLS
ncbi:unnamed protein product, partial [Symbiodinium sp. CCMP2592]